MSTFLYKREFLQQGDIAILNCDTQCNFFLVDDTNFHRYKSGQSFSHYGGFYKSFPVRITASNTGNWNAIIDLGGRQANIRYAMRFRKK